MLIEGKRLDYYLGNRDCFLAVRRNPNENAQTLFGSVVMQNYYYVFDAESTPLKVGMAERANSPDISDYSPIGPDDPVVPPEPEEDEKDKEESNLNRFLLIFGSIFVCGGAYFCVRVL